MSRDKSVWFAEEILLDAKLINYQLESGEWDAVEDMLRAEAQLSRDAETGRLRPKKASEYTLRLIAEVLHIMWLDVEQGSYTRASLCVARQCLRLIRSCAAAGTKMQTFISKELSILDSMQALATAYHRLDPSTTDPEIMEHFTALMTVVMQTLGNLVVNNPYNQIIVWDKLDAAVVGALVGGGAGGEAVAMLLYNILLGQPQLLPADPLLLNSLSELHAAGRPEYPQLVLEYLVSAESSCLDKLYARLEPDCRSLVLAVAANMLATEQQDTTVSVNFIRLCAHEFKVKSDCILKTVDKYVRDTEPAEVVALADLLGVASACELYAHTLQADRSLFINCAFLLRAIHKLGKETNNFFTSVNKLYQDVGRDPAAPISADAPPSTDTANVSPPKDTASFPPTTDITDGPPPTDTTDGPPPIDIDTAEVIEDAPENLLTKKDSADTLISCSSSSSCDQYYECSSLPPQHAAPSPEASGSRKPSVDYKIDMEEEPAPPPARADLEAEPPLIVDSPPAATLPSHRALHPPAPLHPPAMELSPDQSPDEPVTEVLAAPAVPAAPSTATAAPAAADVKRSQNLSTDFNLSEQLEKILGISSEKARSSGESGGARGEDTPRALPAVKIESPDHQRHRAGEPVLDGNTKTVLSDVRSVEQHVAFGVKAALVRLLANLTWQHPHNKRLMRELEVIPVLLDCCNIDARNPLIMQWVIFAVRNLCDGCPENQEVISQLSLEAPVRSELLDEMGLRLHTVDGRLRVVPR